MRKATVVLAVFVLVFSLAADRRRAVGHPGPPTFSKEISRILQENCESCHRPGDIAPFPLISYRDAAAVGTQIKLMTKLGKMPPWRPPEGAGDFGRLPRRHLAQL